MKVKVSAPGKLMLLGEHAVVYGKPCIVTAVDQRLFLEAETIQKAILELIAPDVSLKKYQKPLSELGKGDIPKEAKWVEIAAANFFKRHPEIFSGSKKKILKQVQNDKGIRIKTKSQFKSTFGFGSSSATAVCTVKALSELFNIKITNKEFFDICYKTVLDIQGVGSGFDIAAAIYGGTILYVAPGLIIKPLKVKSLPLVVGYSGTKADTATIVKGVAGEMKKYPKIYKQIFDSIGTLVLAAEGAIAKKDFKKLGDLMDINQGYLEAIGVSSQKLASMIHATRDGGAYGAKLSGAGIGDCMIAPAPKNKSKVEKAIEAAGGQVLKVSTNAEGVRIDS